LNKQHCGFRKKGDAGACDRSWERAFRLSPPAGRPVEFLAQRRRARADFFARAGSEAALLRVAHAR